jgi:hypothetical protein
MPFIIIIATDSITATATAAANAKKSKETRLTVLSFVSYFLIYFFLQSTNKFNT